MPVGEQLVRTGPVAAMRLDAAQLIRRTDPEDLKPPAADGGGAPSVAPGAEQPRARSAIEMSLDVRDDGFNVFVIADSIPDARETVREIVDARRREAHAKAVSRQDWVYVNNFAKPDRPIALALPSGRSASLRDDMRRIVDELQSSIPAAFEAEAYATEIERLQSEMAEHQTEALEELSKEAKRDGIVLLQTPNGFTLAPLDGDEVMRTEVFAKLDEAKRTEIQARTSELQEKLQRTLRAAFRHRKEHFAAVRAVNQRTAALAVEQAFDEIEVSYADLAPVAQWLGQVKADVIDNAERLAQGPKPSDNPFEDHFDLSRYEVNVVSESAPDGGGPIIEVDHPTFSNLIFRPYASRRSRSRST